LAHKSFLTEQQLDQAREILNPPLTTPDGDVRQVFSFSSENLSYWLATKLEEMLKSNPLWKDCHPILLGSWARGEICPKSDIDILFVGEEAKVKDLTNEFLSRGLKLRYRMPADMDDWTANVEAFDILALLKAKPLTPEGAKKLFEQQKKIWSRKKSFRQELLKAVKKERQSRADRYDSITNYLEPNLKYGPGGLRDLEQGLQIYELFAEKFTHPGHALNVLHFYRQYLLTLRQKLHLEGNGDILSSNSQFELGQWMGFKTHKDFMRDLQRGLSRVNFYSDWIVEVAESSEKELKKLEDQKITKAEDLNKLLHKNSGVLSQKKIRENLDRVLPNEKAKSNARRRGKMLEEVLKVSSADAYLVSVFRSRLIDKLAPEIRRLVGYVQHDQYHRFTADSHIMQACREVKRIYKKPAELGPLQFLHKQLTAYDWKVLSWTCLYHDLAKGLESDDHSEQGVHIVKRDFASYGFSKAFTADVQWMVKNHLELSQAAFRKNPKDPRVWAELQNKNVKGAALKRLALFTAIDIRATNPEAWNEWKAKLLKELVVSLESKKAHDYFAFEQLSSKKKLNLSPEVIEELGPVLLDSLPTKDLVEDLQKAEKANDSLKPKVLKNKNEIWVRYHRKEDRTGLLSDYVGQLYSLGLSIRHASIHTLPQVGVYDWFQVSTSKDLTQLTKILENSHVNPKTPPSVKLHSISLISQDDNEWLISFKGPDQAGLLAATAKALSDVGLSIKSARVHTWGRQIDDVFTVKADPKGSAALIEELKRKFELTS